MSKKFYSPGAVTYGMIRGAALDVRKEADSVLDEIRKLAGEGVYSCVCFLKNTLPFESAPDGAAVSCKRRCALQDSLISRDGKPELGNRVGALAGHFGQSIRYFGKAGNVKSLVELLALFDEMESRNPPVPPDRRTLYAGLHTCGTWRDFSSLNERVVKYKIPVDMEFFNKWLETASTFQEVGWVCDRALEAGYPELDYESSRRVFLKLCRGNKNGNLGKVLPLSEVRSLRDWILKNRKGRLWTYVVEQVINPMFVGIDTHVKGGESPFCSMNDGRELSRIGMLPPCTRPENYKPGRSSPQVIRRRGGVVTMKPSETV